MLLSQQQHFVPGSSQQPQTAWCVKDNFGDFSMKTTLLGFTPLVMPAFLGNDAAWVTPATTLPASPPLSESRKEGMEETFQYGVKPFVIS